MKPRKRKKSPFSGFPFRGFNEVPGLLTLTPLPSLSLPGVTILLSLTVFHNLVTETLPQVSDAMPVLGRPWCPTEPRAPYICTNACHGDLGRLSLPSNSVDFFFFLFFFCQYYCRVVSCNGIGSFFFSFFFNKSFVQCFIFAFRWYFSFVMSIFSHNLWTFMLFKTDISYEKENFYIDMHWYK